MMLIRFTAHQTISGSPCKRLLSVYKRATSPRRASLPNTMHPKDATFSTTALMAWFREQVTRALLPGATRELIRCQIVVDFPASKCRRYDGKAMQTTTLIHLAYIRNHM